MTDEIWNLRPAPCKLSPPGVSAVRATMVMRMRHVGCWLTCKQTNTVDF
jgi:hypothetical protein